MKTNISSASRADTRDIAIPLIGCTLIGQVDSPQAAFNLVTGELGVAFSLAELLTSAAESGDGVEDDVVANTARLLVHKIDVALSAVRLLDHRRLQFAAKELV